MLEINKQKKQVNFTLIFSQMISMDSVRIAMPVVYKVG